MGDGVPSALAGSWQQFRGPDRTNVVRDVPPLARSFPSEGPNVLWRIEAGEGHAGAAVHNGRVYMMDYDRDRQEDVVRCLSLDDGREIWRHTYSVVVRRNHGMSRTVPAVTDDYVVTLGPKCHVVCLEARDGTLLWKKDLVEENGTRVPPWYAGQCPLIDGDRVILAPGADPLMMAVDLATGEPVWETENPGEWGMTHSSVAIVQDAGPRQYVYCTTQGVVGVEAETGRLLWTTTDWRITLANVPTPVPLGDGRVLFSGGYNSGAVLLQISEDGPPTVLWRTPAETFASDQQTPIFYKGHIYGVIPSGQMACMDPDGRVLWTSGAANRFGLGPFLIADGLLYVLHDQSCTLYVIEAAPDGYRELASRKLMDGHDAWAPMAVAAGRLILRDVTQVLCIEMPRETG